jgi:isopentenyl diphosphate isomerase/L-lactate dehydrogenase-like FMN-dependent dehydrogenase
MTQITRHQEVFGYTILPELNELKYHRVTEILKKNSLETNILSKYSKIPLELWIYE